MGLIITPGSFNAPSTGGFSVPGRFMFPRIPDVTLNQWQQFSSRHVEPELVEEDPCIPVADLDTVQFTVTLDNINSDFHSPGGITITLTKTEENPEILNAGFFDAGTVFVGSYPFSPLDPNPAYNRVFLGRTSINGGWFLGRYYDTGEDFGEKVVVTFSWLSECGSGSPIHNDGTVVIAAP